MIHERRDKICGRGTVPSEQNYLMVHPGNICTIIQQSDEGSWRVVRLIGSYIVKVWEQRTMHHLKGEQKVPSG